MTVTSSATLAIPAIGPASRARRGRVATALCIAFAVALTLFIQGYQFGRSNHKIYLLDALHRVSPQLLANDWFTTQTLQYHAIFGAMTRTLMSLGILQPAFLIGYLGLVVAMHVAWWRLVRALGGGAAQFIVSQVLFQLAAAGTGLGMYLFLQDSSFLPSNISAVAMLWGITLWLENRPIACGIALGIAGAFHLNYAPVVIVMWMVLQAFEFRRAEFSRRFGVAFWLGSVAAVGPSLLNIAFALRTTAARSRQMPLSEFIDIYVHLRHPHHYDPSSWPAWLWISFLWPIPLAALWWMRQRHLEKRDRATEHAGVIFMMFSTLVIVALLGAGITYISEALVQLSLYRFSIFIKLLACVAAAFLLCQSATLRHRENAVIATAIATGVLLMLICLRRGPYLGLYRLAYEDPSYQSACDWIRDHTPADAVFVVPPHEQEFRLRAQRAIVVNFKAVPQLSGELVEWRRRLEAVLDLPDLRSLPGPYGETLEALRDRYHNVPSQRLADAARRYGARYILVDHRFSDDWEPLRVQIDGNKSWFLYDLTRRSD